MKSTHCVSVGLFGLPPIDRPRASHGRRANNNKAPEIALTECIFDHDPDVPLCKSSHSVTWAHAGPYTWHIATKELVAHATRDVLADTGLSDRLHFFLCGFDLFRPRRDLYCLFRVTKEDPKYQGPFVGAVLAAEGDAANSPRVWSQIYDLLCMFKAYHGATAPLVILSTYAQWRVFWLQGDTESTPASVSVTAARGPAAGALCAGPIMDRADPALVPTIATALHCMHAQISRDPCDILASSSREMRLAAKVSTSSKRVQWVFYRAPRSVSSDDNIACAARRSSAPEGGSEVTAHDNEDDGGACAYMLVKDMGTGGDGHAWRAHPMCENSDDDHTVGDTVVVIKFGHESTDLQPGDEDDVTSGGCIWREALVWRLVWGEHRVRAIHLCGWPALVMPFASPVATDAADAIERGAAPFVLDAIESMAAKGLCHDDLHWRHVGWIGPPIDWSRCADKKDTTTTASGVSVDSGRVIFFDLARVSACRHDKAARRMKKALGLCSMATHATVGCSSATDDIQDVGRFLSGARVVETTRAALWPRD